ncbi:LOW QUALITY PROTEIN: hypothetical protein U9M48_038468 [Paspalum notatum var. saurae]|uniref:Uncharacterized protein n=1 Tax=Paspalum notatum var. saurae TaxID=547442 RepID=A0AAQ3XB36_PASNO
MAQLHERTREDENPARIDVGADQVYSPQPPRLRPYVTVAVGRAGGLRLLQHVAAHGGASGDHAWGDTLIVPVGRVFLKGRADICVAMLSESACRLVGATPLGWCRIPAADVLDGLRPSRALRCPQ